MKFYGDYHTHSCYSDAVGNPIKANLDKAVKLGLKEIAFTEHGFGNIFLGLTWRKYEKEKKAIEKLRTSYPELTILQGIEADIIDFDGSLDMSVEDFDKFDLVIAGFHRFTRAKSFAAWKQFIRANGWTYNHKPCPDELIQKNTEAMLTALKKYPIDILAHINHRMRVDVAKVCSACAEFGTLVEINLKHIESLKHIIKDILPTGCMFVVNSDAHRGEDVGEFCDAVAIIEQYGIPKDRIANLCGRPEFRSKRK